MVLQDIFKSYNDDKISELSETALHLLETISPIDGSRTGDKGAAVLLQGMGINLWNKTVALKSAAAISSQLNAQSVCHKVKFMVVQLISASVLFKCMCSSLVRTSLI